MLEQNDTRLKSGHIRSTYKIHKPKRFCTFARRFG